MESEKEFCDPIFLNGQYCGMDLSSEYLSKKINEGDEATFEYLFRKYYVQLCVYAKRYVFRNDLAEEIVAETFFKLWQNRESISITTSFKGYLFHAVTNNSLNFLRKKKKEESLDKLETEKSGIDLATYELPSDSIIQQELSSIIGKAVAALPNKQQEAFILKKYEGKKNKEIAESMNISVKTVEMHLTKAMSSLRSELKMYLPEFLILFLISNLK